MNLDSLKNLGFVQKTEKYMLFKDDKGEILYHYNPGTKLYERVI